MTKEKLIESDAIYTQISMTERLILEFDTTPAHIMIARIFDLGYKDIDKRITEFGNNLKSDLQIELSLLNKQFELI